MAASQQHSVFGTRKEPHTIIIARGDQIRHFTVRPWAAAILGSVLAAAAVGYLLATTYLVLRDDLIGATVARQARMQQAYEDRIADLRAQVDRITSRQLLDQEQMESKVSELLARQSKLTERHGRLDLVLERAEATGAILGKTTELAHHASADSAPLPQPRPDLAPAPADAAGQPPLAYSGSREQDPFRSLFGSQGRSTIDVSRGNHADEVLGAISQSLRSIETEQISRLRTLTDDANSKTEAIAGALEQAGLKTDVDYGEAGVGGPLLAPSPALEFDTRAAELDEALDTLDAVKEKARQYPIGNPAPGQPISSTFGVRADPILGIPAMHAGMDFRATIGMPVHVTAAGTVTRSGWAGGYGRMVEVDHGGGLSTRYAHLSKILVRKGQKLAKDDVVGLVGSSGRSTGPHVHYEVRENGKATDPLRFLKTGKRLAGLI